jgi:tetratricopeptide (TPR) repeat protein
MSAQPARTIFIELVAHVPPEQWDARLDQLAGEDQALRRKVAALLAAHRQADSFLEQPAVDLERTVNHSSTAAVVVPVSIEQPGTLIAGRYKLLEEIGEGGMGTVWMAEQREPVKRMVALKLIKPGMDSKAVLARFEAERQALALMDHPHIAKVFDGGEAASGRPFFVMELVKGVPITKFCDERKLTPKERLELFLPVCHAIQHAHQKGIIHRDIKPNNVLVALYDDQPVPKVIDFGVAKATGSQLTEKSMHTGFGQVVGTLEYMSPEQASFNQLDVDTRSDIYSLGVLLYELLTGSPPFSRKELEKAGMLEMLRVIREQEPSKPSTKLSTAEGLPSLAAQRGTEPAKLTRLVRGELDWIVMKALEKDRNRRYETANAFAADVHRYLSDETVQACPPSTIYRLKKLMRRNKTRLAVAAGVFLAVTVMAASIGWSVRDRVARRAEIEQAETARQATVAGQVRDSLNTARVLIAENKLASAREKLAQAKAQLGNDGPALANLAAEVEAGAAELNRFQQFLDLIDRAHQAETAPHLESTLVADDSSGRAGTPTPARVGSRRPTAAVPFVLEALQHYGILDRDDWKSALESGLLERPQVEQIRRIAYEELLWLADDVVRRQQEHRSGGMFSPEAAARQSLVYLGHAEGAHRPTQALYALRARCRKALGDEAAAQGDRQLADKTPATMALDHALRGQAAYDAKQLAEGVEAFEAALRLEPTHYWSMMRLGYCLCDLGQGPGDFVSAARVFTGCILKRPDHAHAYCCRGNAYRNLRRFDEAVADYARAIELDPKYAYGWSCRGNAYLQLGQADKAVADHSRAVELAPQHAYAWRGRGNAHSKLGQPGKAVADFSRAIELDPKSADTWTNRGNAYLRLRNADKAVADYSRAVELDPKHTLAWYNRGVAYSRLGRPADAVADYSRAIELNPKYTNAWTNRGHAYLTLGQPDKAVPDFSRVVELDPKHAIAWYNRGFAYLALDREDKAVADLSRALELDPQHADAWANRGHSYFRLGQADKAVADYSRAVELDPKHTIAWAYRGYSYLRLGRAADALTDCSRAVELDPKYAIAWSNRGNAYLRLGQADKAVADCSRAVELEPKLMNGWSTLGKAHYRAGDSKAAVAALNKSWELRKSWDGHEWFVLAMAHRKLGHPDEARKAYEQALLWLEKNQEALAKDKRQAEDLRRLRAEAEEVLELKKK